MAYVPPQNPGDRHPKIPAAKQYLGKFSYGKNLGDTDEYTVPFGVALTQWQVNIHDQVVSNRRPGPDVNVAGIFDWAVQRQMGLLEPPKPLQVPLIVTVPGHMGGLFIGPEYVCARWLEEQGLARVQPVGYDSHRVPFNNKSGMDELWRIINDPVINPPGVPFAITSHSQGAIIASYIEERMLRGEGPAGRWRGGIHFGNPRRPRHTTARWVADPSPHDSEGLAHNCHAPMRGVEEVSRDGDFYANKKLLPDGRPDPASENMTAVYRAIAESDFLSGTDTLGEQMLELVKSGGFELWNIFKAITRGVTGVSRLEEHGVFDMGPCIDHLRRILAV